MSDRFVVRPFSPTPTRYSTPQTFYAVVDTDSDTPGETQYLTQVAAQGVADAMNREVDLGLRT
jgi:hypothetical protein